MKKLNNIFEIIEKENIIIEEVIIRYNGNKGLYINIQGIPPTILIDKSIINNRCQYISILSEELGHHFTTLGNLPKNARTYSEKLQKNKKEKLAKLWAADFLINDDAFVKALYDCISNPCDMCEYFNVTDEILKYKVASILRDEVKYNNIRKNFELREVPYNCCTI